MRVCVLLWCICLLSAIQVLAQPTVRITGIVTTESEVPLEGVAVSVLGQSQSAFTEADGSYTIYSKTTNFILKYSFLGYVSTYVRFIERKAGRTTRDVFLKPSINELEQVAITDKRNQLSNTTIVNIADINAMPSASMNFENILKTLPGVSVNNELSAQYSVRGGNFDENIVYLNGIEINRPQFLRNGQHEGLSFINSDLATTAKFSSGGFEAKYGDKLSSVLDVSYDRPDSNQVIAAVGILGSSLAVKQAYKNSYLLAGARYKNNRSVLSRQDVRGRFNPNFTDFQLLYEHDLSKKLKLSVVGNLNGGVFRLVPDSRETEFGTLSSNLHLNVGYSGEEKATYFSTGGAITAAYAPRGNILWTLTNSYFRSNEHENTDIIGTYYLDETTVNKPAPGTIGNNRTVGAFISFIDNRLTSRSVTSELKAEQNFGSHVLSWGLKYQEKRYREELHELNQIDAGTPLNPNNLYTDYFLFQKNTLTINHFSAFIQDSYSLGAYTDLQLGTRIAFNSISDKLMFSPRMLVAYRPKDNNKIVRFSAGIYHQDPDYRTIKDVDGSLNINQAVQRNYSTSLGLDYAFSGLGTRLKFTSEAYFKYADRLIPYITDNLKLRYFANQTASGYVYGADFTLGGEFVKDLVSYFRLSLMKANQHIHGQGIPGFLKRPTDQRVNFSVFFQDRLLTSPTYKVHLNILYGSQLPIGAPNLQRYSDNFRIPAYKRADIGFSKDFLDDASLKKSMFLGRYFTSFIAYVEVFNMLNTNNTASYLWLKDVYGTQYAIPNYLTGRQLNFKLIAKFRIK